MRYFIFVLLLHVGLVNPINGAANILAFPSAEGFGAYSIGGRGGKVIEVTNLNDSGLGSFRNAVEDTIPRTVVFRLSGTIELKSELRITHSYLTIAGQTAPGDGICLKNYPLIIDGAHNIIIRAIRVRPGIESGLIGSEIDGLQIRNSHDVIIDHCTVSWSVDEILNTWHGSKDITIQWCIFAEPLNHSVHEKGAHGYGASLGGIRATYHHNLFANCAGRNPSVAGNNIEKTELMDFRNNVIFNRGHRTCDGKPSSINMVNNYYKPGPAVKPSVLNRIAKVESAEKYGFACEWYIDGNAIEGFPEIEKDNVNLGVEAEGINKLDLLTDHPFPTVPVKTQSANEAYKLVLENVGVVCAYDSWEKRLLNEVETGKVGHGNGHIDKVDEAGGWPILESKILPVDTDHDGMPDQWENAKGLNLNMPDDASAIYENGFTNLEIYLNTLLE